jgi:hypothetical protein
MLGGEDLEELPSSDEDDMDVSQVNKIIILNYFLKDGFF